jgi:hypothetical protein
MVNQRLLLQLLKLLMLGMRMPETCWAVFKQQVINLSSCCIWLVDSVGSMMIHGLANHKFEKIYMCVWRYISYKIKYIRCVILKVAQMSERGKLSTRCERWQSCIFNGNNFTCKVNTDNSNNDSVLFDFIRKGSFTYATATGNSICFSSVIRPIRCPLSRHAMTLQCRLQVVLSVMYGRALIQW